MSSHPPRVSPEDWKRHEETIKDLYYSQGLPLQSKNSKRSLIQVMRDTYNFSATRSQYEAQFIKWNSGKNVKNVKRAEWKLILAQIDQLRGQNKDVRLRVSGRIITKDQLKRARRYVQTEPAEVGVSVETRLSVAELCHISIEIQGEDGEWSKYLPPDSLRSCRHFGQLLAETCDSSMNLAVQQLIPVESASISPGDLGDGHDSLCQRGWSPFPRTLGPWPPGTFLPDSPGSARYDATGYQIAGLDIQRIWTTFPDILSQPSPFYQLGLDFLHQCGQSIHRDSLKFVSAEVGHSQAPSSTSLILPSSRHYIRLLLQDAIISRQVVSLPPEDTRLPSVDGLLERLQSLLPESVQQTGPEETLGMTQGSSKFEQIFLDIMVYSIANGFAGFRGVSIGSIFKLIRSQSQISSKLFACLQKCPIAVANPLASNLFCAAIEACDAQAVNLIIETIKEKGIAIYPDEIVCEYQDRMFTPVELASKLRSTETVQILLSMGADVNKTYEEDEDMEQGALELVIRKRAESYEPVDLNLIQALLDAGAEVRVGLIMRVSRWDSDLRLQKELITRIRPNAHRSFIQNLWYMAENLDDGVAVQLTRLLFRFCEQTECFQCVTASSGCVSCTRIVSQCIPEALNQAARRGNLALCKFLLAYTSAKDTTLSAAIRSSDRATVDLIVNHGAGVQGRAAVIDYLNPREYSYDDLGTTPLAEAIRSKDHSFLQLVEQLGAWDCVKQDGHFRAAILAAADAEDTNMLARLLSEVPNLRGHHLTCALVQVIRQDNTPAALMLLAAGADVNFMPNTRGPGPSLIEALNRRNVTVVDMILESDVDVKACERLSNIRPSVMELAGQWGNVTILKTLISMGFGMDFGMETTALAAAVKSGNRDLVHLLLTCGANPSAVAVRGNSPLHEAVQKVDEEMIQHLLSVGADPADHGAFVCAIEKQRESVSMLVRAFTDRYPNGRTGFGADLLMKAMEVDDTGLLKVLLMAKMDTRDFSQSKKCTPLGFAVRHQGGNNLDLVRYLLAAGVSVNSIVAAPFGRGGGYADAGNRIWPQETALILAIETMNEKMTELILQNGGDVNQAARNGVKRTPLQKACEMGSFKIVKLLLDWGANVNDPPSHRGGGTALQLASGTGSISIVQLLLSYGADIHAPTSDVEGRSALEAAAENGRLDMLKVLWDTTHSIGFPASETERAVSLAKKKGHRACAEYVAELEAASNRVFSQSSAQIDFV